MKFENIKEYPCEKFRRITGVKRNTFEKMLEILRPAKDELTAKGSPKPRLCLEDMLLAALEYLREYRTYAHMAASYGLSESSIYRIIKWVEDTLISDGVFSLPGRKALSKSDTTIEVVFIDATESPIERPKKDRGFGIAVLFKSELQTALTRHRSIRRISKLSAHFKSEQQYSGKKKRHTMKTQIVVDKNTKNIICTRVCSH